MHFAAVHFEGQIVGVCRIYVRFTKNKPIVAISSVVVANRRRRRQQSALGFGVYRWRSVI